ncbi:ATP-binding protein [Arthrobacter alpinus]|nr:ATP-binding protein [Arthrobacter alpinus]
MSVGSAIEQLRLMARTLLPSMVSTHGFADAVEYFVVGVKTPVSLRLHLDNVVPQAVELAAYQVLVEAVLNAERHARATTITVDLSTDADTLILSVADNGVGILPECVPGWGWPACVRRSCPAAAN